MELPRLQAKRGHQDTNRARTHEDMEEAQEAGREPTQEVETVDNVVVQEDKEVEPALSHSAALVDNGEVESVEEYIIHHMKMNMR